MVTPRVDVFRFRKRTSVPALPATLTANRGSTTLAFRHTAGKLSVYTLPNYGPPDSPDDAIDNTTKETP